MSNSLLEKSWLGQAWWGILVWLLVGVLLTAMQYLPRSVDGAVTFNASKPLGSLAAEYNPAEVPLASFADLRVTETDTATTDLPPLNLIEPAPEGASTTLNVGWINPEWLQRLLAEESRTQSQRLGGKELQVCGRLRSAGTLSLRRSHPV